MLGEPPTAVAKTMLSFLEMCEDLLLVLLLVVDMGRRRSSSTSCYNPTGWTTTTCMFLEMVSTSQYKVVQNGFEAGLCKQQISNVFANQEGLRVANIFPLATIDTFSGARNGKINTDFYDDCQNIPDPRALDPNLMLLDDCFL